MFFIFCRGRSECWKGDRAVKLIDTHAHLDDRAYAKDRAALIADLFAQEIGVITIGSDLASSREAVELAERHHTIWAAVGIHPHDARFADRAALQDLETLAEHASVVAIGEIGLDYYRDLSPREVQRKVFRQQLDLALRLGLPTVIHNRESTSDLLAVLRSAGNRHNGVVHSFLGDPPLARSFIELGLHLGIGGPITYPRNDALRDAVRQAPLERLVVETDCPYLPPVPHRGARNEPAYVRLVVEAVAALRNTTPDEIARATTENAISLFRLRSAA